MITNYLIELLKDNECVIIPEFGAFISKRHSATIDFSNNRFMPPYKELVFNDKLSNNDDVLVNYIAKKEQISYDEALSLVQKFVNQSLAILEVNNELYLENFGKLKNINGNIIFKLDENVNLLGDSFGLTSFDVQPIFRTETYNVIREKIYVEQKAKNTNYSVEIETADNEHKQKPQRRSQVFRMLTYTIAFFLVFVAVNWTTDKSDSNMASWNPFLYSSPNEYFINILNSNMDIEEAKYAETSVVEVEQKEEVLACDETVTAEQMSAVETVISLPVEETAELPVNELSAEPEEVIIADKIEEKQVEPIVENCYFIVGGSFRTEESAEKCVNNIRKKGFEAAAMMPMNDAGNIRVYYESFATKSEALPRLDIIKNEYDESAWLLYQKIK